MKHSNFYNKNYDTPKNYAYKSSSPIVIRCVVANEADDSVINHHLVCWL